MLKLITFVAGLGPLGYCLWQVYLLQSGGTNALGADPGKALVLLQGEWAIRFLLLALLVTPIRQLTAWTQVMRIRRMLGLFTFFYASLHLIAFVVLLLELNFGGLWQDIEKRPYITVGFLAWLMLLPLAVTSTNWMMRFLRKRWQMLHRVVYGVAILAVVHVFWLAKSSYAEAAFYGGILAFLLFYRVFRNAPALFPKTLKKTF